MMAGEVEKVDAELTRSLQARLDNYPAPRNRGQLRLVDVAYRERDFRSDRRIVEALIEYTMVDSVLPITINFDDWMALHHANLSSLVGHIIDWAGLVRPTIRDLSGVWKHYKGGLYQVIGVGFAAQIAGHPQSVFYREIQTGYRWCRPLAEWSEVVEHEGRKVPRFAMNIIDPPALEPDFELVPVPATKTLSERLGEVLKRARESAKLTRYEAATKAGIGPFSARSIEGGSDFVTMGAISLYAEAIGIDLAIEVETESSPIGPTPQARPDPIPWIPKPGSKYRTHAGKPIEVVGVAGHGTWSTPPKSSSAVVVRVEGEHLRYVPILEWHETIQFERRAVRRYVPEGP